MRVLIISHSYIAPENRHKITVLGQKQDLEIGVLFPPRWIALGRHLFFLQQSQDTERHWTFTCPVYGAGDNSKYIYDPICLRRDILEFKPDLIHVEEEPWSRCLGEIAILSKITSSRLIFFSWENLELSLSFAQQQIRRLVFSQSIAALVGNEEAKSLLQKSGFGKRVDVITQFGADTDAFVPLSLEQKQAVRERLGLTGFVVGFAGRLVEEKGIGTLLRAIAELKKTAPNCRLLLVSTTIIPSEFEDMIEDLNITDSVVVADGLDHDRIREYTQVMDCLVLPSLTTPTWKEQFGRVLTEAMACQVAVIGSSSGAIPEVIGEAGLIFKEGDAGDLVSKISLYYQDPSLLQDKARMGYQRVQEKYSFKAVAEKTYQLYKQILEH